MSMVLTSKAHRRRTPKISRRIPTIPTGCFDGWIVNVSAVDTGPRGSESGVLGGARRLRHRSAPGRPTARGAGSTGQGVCVLHEGPTYLQYPPAPPPVAPHPRAVHQMTPAATGVTGAAPLRQTEAQLSHLADAPKR
ncbi:hypothetical protein BKH32_05655 [Actinomyces oris]|uniref:Uncharacterized protein n=1 Tax=Actinomyces oris TaxID=544580 RepID=A0A1Q8I1M4_9ACTO|nr:hypothetical protein BKH32_05655 [Actinomyces oris]